MQTWCPSLYPLTQVRTGLIIVITNQISLSFQIWSLTDLAAAASSLVGPGDNVSLSCYLTQTHERSQTRILQLSQKVTEG